MPRNVTFFILALTSAVAAYIFYPSIDTLVELIISDSLPRKLVRLLQNSDLVAFAGFVSLFGLSFVLLYMVFPTALVWYQISSAQNIIAQLPTASNPTRRTDKKTFLAQLKGLGFIDRMVDAFEPYLIQGPEQEVSGDTLKHARLMKRVMGGSKNSKIMIAPVCATAPAQVVFNSENLVFDNLYLRFFYILARLTIGVGIICLGISVVSFSLARDSNEAALLSTALQPGLIALLYCLVTATVMTALVRLVDLILVQKAHALTRGINDLFTQGEWQRDLGKLKESLADHSISAQLETLLKTSLEKPMKEISKAVKALAAEQERKLDSILSATLESFARDLQNKAGADAKSLNKALKDAARSADEMKNNLSKSGADYSKQMDRHASFAERQLADMQKILLQSGDDARKGTEVVISSFAAEVEAAYQRLGEFMEVRLKQLDEKQAAVETAHNDSDSILGDLHTTAKDLGTIANASSMLLDKFTSLSLELNSILKYIQGNGITQASGDVVTRDKLKTALVELKKNASDKIGKLPDM